MPCPILVSPALVVSSLRARCAGKQSHIEQMGYSLDAQILKYIERMGGLQRPTKKELASAQSVKKHNLRTKARWERREREEAAHA